MKHDDNNVECSNCGRRFDVAEQFCPNCHSLECGAYKPWIGGADGQEEACQCCKHSPNCPW